MDTTTTTTLAEHVIAALRAHESELRRAGVKRLSLFGSVARSEARADSDVDLAAEFDPAAGIDLIDLIALERRASELVGRPVEISSGLSENPRFQASVERDGRVVF